MSVENDDLYIQEQLANLRFRSESEACWAVDRLNSGDGLRNEVVVASLVWLVVDESTYEEYWEVEAIVYRSYSKAVLDLISPLQ